jgi:hypothetical protein
VGRASASVANYLRVKKIDRVLDQQEKMTKATETIKTELSDKSLSKQRLRDMRREVAFKLVNMLGSIEETMIGASAEAQLVAATQHMQPEPSKKMNELYERYRNLLRRMVQINGQVTLVFDEPARELLHLVLSAANTLIDSTNKFKYRPESVDALMTIYNERSVKIAGSRS